jgi:hypothetical protein
MTKKHNPLITINFFMITSSRLAWFEQLLSGIRKQIPTLCLAPCGT